MNGINDIIERETDDEPQEPIKQPTGKIQPRKWGNPRRKPLVLDPEAPRKAPLTTSAPQPQPQPSNQSDQLSEDERIHLENIRKLQQMTPQQIEQEREEIFRSMNPDVLQSLLRRAELKEQEQHGPKKPSIQPPANATNPTYGVSAPPRGTITDWDPSGTFDGPNGDGTGINENVYIEREIPADHPSVEIRGDPSTVHFPPAPDQMREFFPDLPMETDKLAWMQPVSEAEEQEYSTQLVSVAPSELRFDFHGNLITPKLSRKIPTTMGLHHHGDAPSAAGYTIPELAHLCRSSYSPQRSMAIQTIGRVLHKLRRKVYAKSSDLQEGLEQLVNETRILDTLVECADEKTRSLTVRSLATEALWLANSK